MNKIIKTVIGLVVVLAIARFFFPPLTELGYANPSEGVTLQVMFDPHGGVEPLPIYVEAADAVDVSSYGLEICDSLVADLVAGNVPLEGINPAGTIEIIFVSGGRHFYRWMGQETVSFDYTAEGCVANG